MFGLDSFTDLPNPRDLAKIFDKSNPENTKWLSFRDSEDSRFVALTVPHVLGRLPYGKATVPGGDLRLRGRRRRLRARQVPVDELRPTPSPAG